MYPIRRDLPLLGGYAETLHVVVVNSIEACLADSGVAASAEDAGDEVLHAVLLADVLDLVIALLVSPVVNVDHGVVDLAPEGDLRSVLLDELLDVVGASGSLPYVDTHLDHAGNEVGSIGVAVVYDVLYAVALVVAVDLGECGNDEFIEHFR